jgi:hypothetical protein
MHTKLLLENLRRRDYVEDLGVDGKIIFDWMSGKYGRDVCIACIWLKIGTSGSLL